MAWDFVHLSTLSRSTNKNNNWNDICVYVSMKKKSHSCCLGSLYGANNMTKLFQSNYQIQNYVKWHIIFSFVKWHLSIIQIHTIQIQIVLSYYKLYIFERLCLENGYNSSSKSEKTENTHREKLNCILQNIHNAKWSCSHTHTHTHTHRRKPQEELCFHVQDRKTTVMCRICNKPIYKSHAVYYASCLQCTD